MHLYRRGYDKVHTVHFSTQPQCQYSEAELTLSTSANSIKIYLAYHHGSPQCL